MSGLILPLPLLQWHHDSMALVEANKAPARGGRRQGAGRPALPDGERKDRIVLYVRPGAAAALRKFQEVTSGPDAAMP